MNIPKIPNDNPSSLAHLPPLDPQFVAQLRLAARLKNDIAEARKSPLGLYKLCFSADDGSPIIIKWFHEEWNEMIMRYQGVLIEASRGLTKSTFLTATALWLIGCNKNIRIKWLGASDPKARKRRKVISEYIEDSPLYKEVFPDIALDYKKPNNVEMLTVVREAKTPEPTLEAKGVLSAGTGDRSDALLLDDIVDMRNSLLLPALRPQVVSKLLSDWMPTLTKEGIFIDICNVWHEEDANSHIRRMAESPTFAKRKCTEYSTKIETSISDKSKVVYKRYSHGTAANPHHSICPEITPEAKLVEEHKLLGDLHYGRAYLCQAFSKDTVAILPEHLHTYDASQLTPEIISTATCVLSIDPSTGKDLTKAKLDYMGVTISLLHIRTFLDPKTKTPIAIRYTIFIPEAFRIKLPVRSQITLIKLLAARWSPSHILIETAGMQNLHEWIYEEKDLNRSLIQPVSTHNIPKGQRLLAITPYLDRSIGDPNDPSNPPLVRFHPRVINPTVAESVFTIRLPSDPNNLTSPPISYQAERSLRHELLNFPTEHDDCMDSFTQDLSWQHTFLIPKTPATASNPYPNAPVISAGITAINY